MNAATDHLVPIAEVARKLGRTGATVRNWIEKGLDARKIGGTWFTTFEAVEAFAKRARSQEREAVTPVPSPANSPQHLAAVEALRSEFNL